MLLARLGLLDGRKATIYPGMEAQLGAAEPQDVPAVTDGMITTGHGPGAAVEFALELIRVINGEAASEGMRKQVVFQH